MPLEITAARPDPALLDLPWARPAGGLAGRARSPPCPRGISRHIVRFVKLSGPGAGGQGDQGRHRRAASTQLLRMLERLDLPCVEPFGVVSGRRPPDGHAPRRLPDHPAPAVLAALPRAVQPVAAPRHRAPASSTPWPCCSSGCTSSASGGATSRCPTPCSAATPAPSPHTSSTPRPASCTQTLTAGQREHDLEIARVNIAGELMDLEAGGFLEEVADPSTSSNRIVEPLPRAVGGADRARSGSSAATAGGSTSGSGRLNELGFDVDELAISTDIDGTTIQIQPKVVDAGHHSRRLLRLTGLDVEENQARRLLNDLDSYRAAHRPPERRRGDRRPRLAGRGSTSPSPAPSPASWRGKLEPAELFHEVLEHRWYLSERAGHDVPDRGRDPRLRRPGPAEPSPTRRPSSASTPSRCRSSPCSTTRGYHHDAATAATVTRAAGRPVRRAAGLAVLTAATAPTGGYSGTAAGVRRPAAVRMPAPPQYQQHGQYPPSQSVPAVPAGPAYGPPALLALRRGALRALGPPGRRLPARRAPAPAGMGPRHHRLRHDHPELGHPQPGGVHRVGYRRGPGPRRLRA